MEATCNKDLGDHVKMPEDTAEQMVESQDELYEKLENQEKDLMLAAELGKALLDKNEEISRQGEAIVLEYLQKLEVIMSGDKHFDHSIDFSGFGARKISFAEKDGSVRRRISATVDGITGRY